VDNRLSDWLAKGAAGNAFLSDLGNRPTGSSMSGRKIAAKLSAP